MVEVQDLDILTVSFLIDCSLRLQGCQGMTNTWLGVPARATLAYTVRQQHNLSDLVLQERMQQALGIVDKRQDNIYRLRCEAEEVCLGPLCMTAQLAYAHLHLPQESIERSAIQTLHG